MMSQSQFFRNVLFFLIGVTSLSCLHAQSGFVFKYSTPNDEWPNDLIETSDGGFIVSISSGTYNSNYNTLLIRLSVYGDTINTKLLSSSGGYCILSKIIKLDNGTFTGIGYKKELSGNQKIWLLTFDDSLNIIRDSLYATTNLFHFTNSNYGFIDVFRHLVVYAGAYEADSIFNIHTLVINFNQNGDLLSSHYYSASGAQYPFSMCEKSDTSGYFLLIFGEYQVHTNTFSQILTLDNTWRIINIDSIPGSLTLYLNSKTLNNKELLITGKKYFENNPTRTDKIGILKLDSTFQIKKEFFLGPDDTVSYPAYNTNMDYLNVQNIFVGGLVNQDYGGIFSYNLSYIILGKFDSSLNLKWQKYFGGDTYYMVWSVIATSDGGCIIGASTNDYVTMGEERDVYILKLDSNGLITGIPHPPSNTNDKILIYPNPGNDMMYVENNLGTCSLFLCDLTGRTICSRELSDGRNLIDVKLLKPGLYLYKLLQNSEIKQAGKWIKQ